MMIFRTRREYAIFVSFLLLLSAAQSEGGVRADLKERVFERLLRSDAESVSFISKITLRYGDSDSQLVVLTYPVYPVHPRGRAELISYTITGMGNDNLSQFISRLVAQNPSVTDEQIAAKLKVEIRRSSINYEVLKHCMDELDAITISPKLPSRVAVDEYSDYQFSYNNGQESVHYKIVGPFKDDPQDKLVQWMIKFRSSLPELMSAASAKR
jgi:hypothetical protein